MPDVFSFLSAYINYFPIAAFVCLLLAAFNFPISEEVIIITGALLSLEKPSVLVFNLVTIYIGVFTCDSFVYWIGTRVRKGTAKRNFFSRLIPEKAVEKMHNILDKYGIFTFIVCRFIPFGARNTLFFTSGFTGLRPKVFALYDIIAAMISINTLFFLTLRFGEEVKRPAKIAGVVLFFVVASVFISMIIRLVVLWRRRATSQIIDTVAEK